MIFFIHPIPLRLKFPHHPILKLQYEKKTGTFQKVGPDLLKNSGFGHLIRELLIFL